MKQLATIGIVVLLLIGTALYLKFNHEPTPDEPHPEPLVEAPIPDPMHKPVITAESAGTLTLKSALSNGYLLQGEPRDLYLSIDVEAVDQKLAKRLPLNIAVVIDRSGSMRGEKIEHAKNAALKLLSQLGPDDQFAVISYSDRAKVELGSRQVIPFHRTRLEAAIRNINPSGATNLSGGLTQAMQELVKSQKANMVNRILLLSDGRPTAGMKSQYDLVSLSKNALRSQISVSTLGVGLDYNENLMTAIAKEGTGNYYFVDRPEQIQAFLLSEISGLASILARNAVVDIKLGDGVRLASLHGFPYTQSGQTISLNLAEFSAKQIKNALLQLNTVAMAEGVKPIASAQLSYQDKVKQKPALQSVALSSVVTKDAKLAQTAQNVDVVARMQQVEFATEVDAAMDLWESGNRDEAKKKLKTTKKKMNKRRSVFKFKDDRKYEAAEAELDDLDGMLDSAPAESEPAKRARKKSKGRSFKVLQEKSAF